MKGAKEVTEACCWEHLFKNSHNWDVITLRGGRLDEEGGCKCRVLTFKGATQEMNACGLCIYAI